MARFEAKVKELAGELNDLWEENDRVDWEIEKFAKDVMPWTYRKEGEDIEVKKIEREGEGLKEKMEELCSEAMERMKESEKVSGCMRANTGLFLRPPFSFLACSKGLIDYANTDNGTVAM